MNNNYRILVAALLAVAALWLTEPAYAQGFTQEYPKYFEVEVKNPLDQHRRDVMILLKEEDIAKADASFNSKAFVVLAGKTEIPSQYNEKDSENPGLIAILDELGPEESRILTIRFIENGEKPRAYKKRTQAELSHRVGGHFENRKYIGGIFQNVDSLRVPDAHTDHSYFIRYEGPGWESDKVGYRFYLDWRNGVDVFGKKTADMVLQEVGQDGFDSYHNMQDWGMDILKVGNALGVGSLAMFHNGKAVRVDKTDSIISVISENGDVYSSITTNYYGWKVADKEFDIQSQLSIHAGSRLTHQQVQVNGNPENLSTGLTKDKVAKLTTSKGNNDAWGYMTTYGKQSLNKDNVGLAILFAPQDFMEFTEDEFSHVVKLKPENGRLGYYFLAAWELEKEGIKTEEAFMEYLEKIAKELAKPVLVSFK